MRYRHERILKNERWEALSSCLNVLRIHQLAKHRLLPSKISKHRPLLPLAAILASRRLLLGVAPAAVVGCDAPVVGSPC